MTANIQSDNAYEILGVPRDAGAPAIKQAFRKLALRYHPDAVPEAEKARAGELFARINQARELLFDSDKRRKYDALLDRGITPDLTQEVGDVPVGNLADILGEIQALNLKVDQKQLLDPIDKKLRDDMLLPALEATSLIHETVIDAVRLDGLPVSAGYQRPPGELDEGWLVVTELRMIVLLRFLHRYEQGNTRYTQTHWAGYYFWYPSLTSMLVHELGRAFPSYQLELENEEQTRFVMDLRAPRLTRLFLVANTYKLPLKILSRANRGDEIAAAVGKSLVLPFLWCVPFVVYTLYHIIDTTCGKGKTTADPFGPYGTISDFLTTSGLSTLVLYGAPLIFTYLNVRVFKAWSVGHAREMVGNLKVDFASGEPAGGEAGATPAPKFPPPRTPSAERCVLPSSRGAGEALPNPAGEGMPSPDAARMTAGETTLSAAALVQQLAARDVRKRQEALAVLGRLGPEAREALPAIRKAMRDPDESIRWRALEAAGDIGTEDTELLTDLSAALQDSDGMVRLSAVKALGKLGPKAGTALDALRAALQDKNAMVRKEAAAAIKTIE